MNLSKNRPKSCKDKSQHCTHCSTQGLVCTGHQDNTFRQFRKIVAKVSKSSTASNNIVPTLRKFFKLGSDGKGFKSDIHLWCRLLMPEIDKRDYNLDVRKLATILCELFECYSSKKVDELIQNNLGSTIQALVNQNPQIVLVNRSVSYITMQDVDDFLEILTTLNTHEEQSNHFRAFIGKCSSNDLKGIIRLICYDLRMDATTKDIIESLHPDAYELYVSCNDLYAVINHCCGLKPIRDPSLYIFKDVKAILEEGVVTTHSMLIRKFISLGGTVLSFEEINKATHVFHLDDTVSDDLIEAPKSARHVILEWVMHSLEKNCLQDFRLYTVTMSPH